MAVFEPAWKKFLKLKSDVPIATANIADTLPSQNLKRKRDPAPESKNSILKKTKPISAEAAIEKKTKANKQKKRVKTKGKRHLLLYTRVYD